MKDLKKLLVIIIGGGIGILPGLVIAFLAWFPLRSWIFEMIPAGVEWAFFAKLASVLVIFFTVGGSLPIWLAIVGGVIGLKLAAIIVE